MPTLHPLHSVSRYTLLIAMTSTTATVHSSANNPDADWILDRLAQIGTRNDPQLEWPQMNPTSTKATPTLEELKQSIPSGQEVWNAILPTQEKDLLEDILSTIKHATSDPEACFYGGKWLFVNVTGVHPDVILKVGTLLASKGYGIDIDAIPDNPRNVDRPKKIRLYFAPKA